MSEHTCGCPACDDTLPELKADAPRSPRHFSASFFNPALPVQRGLCRVMLNDEDVTAEALEGEVGSDGWVALYGVDPATGKRHFCGNHPRFGSHPRTAHDIAPGVCVEVRRGNVQAVATEQVSA